ncbi:hypothetical protein HK104_007697, partial [Borealophlyctis nickersoniae]
YLSTPMGWGKPGTGSAQSWWFWPGIALMLFTAFAELMVNWRSLAGAVRDSVKSIVLNARRAVGKRKEETGGEGEKREVEDLDPVKEEDQVPTSWWGGGLCVSAVFSCFVMSYFFTVPIYQSLLSIIFAFFLSLVGIQAAAETDINPISTLGKVVQIAFAKFPAASLMDLQRNNVLSAAMTSASASQAVDMVGDLKTGHLINASPKSQFLAQLVGSAFAIPISVVLFLVFAKAYPCIVVVSDTCEFG